MGSIISSRIQSGLAVGMEIYISTSPLFDFLQTSPWTSCGWRREMYRYGVEVLVANSGAVFTEIHSLFDYVFSFFDVIYFF